MIITDHFIKRYFQRVLYCENILDKNDSISVIYSDIENRLKIHQKNAYKYFIGNNIKKISLPLGDRFSIIIKEDCAVTVY